MGELHACPLHDLLLLNAACGQVRICAIYFEIFALIVLEYTDFHIHIEQCKAVELQKVIKKIAIQHKDFGIDCKLAASSAPYHFNLNCGVDINSSCKYYHRLVALNLNITSFVFSCSIQCNVNRRYVVNYNSALLCSPQIRKHFLFASINMEQQHEMVVNVNILLSDWSRFFICVQQFISLLSSNPYGLPHLCSVSEQWITLTTDQFYWWLLCLWPRWYVELSSQWITCLLSKKYKASPVDEPR
ncbi:hypothetical protein Tsp_03982 [Trichinella spiralis]|uniref:hypothetical protein n=1 Tax=Trichinella spiralis TaxID=6334 RepID=UPI0001EFCAE7|nr:hypothetical protein Tsp_03982 [Trichinella spiralis]